MAGKRPKPEEIVSKLRQVEVLQGQGVSIADAVRQIGVTQQTYYRWRKLYGGMGREQFKRLKELERENQRHCHGNLLWSAASAGGSLRRPRSHASRPGLQRGGPSTCGGKPDGVGR